MEKLKVKALKAHSFGGVEYKEGDTYEVSGDSGQTAAQYADTLLALQFATLDTGKKKAEKEDDPESPTYSTREMKAKR